MEDEDPLAHGSGRMSGKEPRGVSVGMGQVLLAGAVWIVPSATETVIVAEPCPTLVTVTVFPETDTVAMPVLLDVAEIAPSPVRVTVIYPYVLFASMVKLFVLRLRDPATLTILQDIYFVSLVPSDHSYPLLGVNVI